MRFQTLVQFVVIVFLLALFFFVVSNGPAQNNISATIIVNYILFFLGFASIYVLHAYVIFPLLYAKKKYILYCTSLVAILLFVVAVRPYELLLAQHNQFEHAPPMWHGPPQGSQPPHFDPKGKKPGPPVDIISICALLLVIVLSTSSQINKQLRKTQQRALKAEAEQKQAELSFLKAQVNPHFLFNVLNNIYTLALLKDEATAPAIHKLSHLMRYMADEKLEDKVPLAQEIECICNYIDLQRLRLSSTTTVNFETKGNFDNHHISPLILMAFIENAFKFGISNHLPSTITVLINLEDNVLKFVCNNTIHLNKMTQGSTGIGLTNTKRRLALLYHNQHSLVVDNSTNNWHQVTLSVNL